jgi:hypothetical protein
VLLSGCKSCATTAHGFSSGLVAVVSVRQSGIHVKVVFPVLKVSIKLFFDSTASTNLSLGFPSSDIRNPFPNYQEEESGRTLKKKIDDRNEPEHEVQLNI